MTEASISLTDEESDILCYSIFHDEKEDQERLDYLFRKKLQLLTTLLSIRYMYSRMYRIPKAQGFRDEVIGALPLDKFRHFFRMNPDSFLRVLDRIENHQVFKNNARVKQVGNSQPLRLLSLFIKN